MKWIVSVPIGNTELQKNFVCHSKEDVEKILEQFEGAEITVEPESEAPRKNYRLIYRQKFMGKIIQDVTLKFDKTVDEMEEAVKALYSDPCVFKVWYEEMGAEKCEKPYWGKH